MTSITTTIITCDVCKREIDLSEKYINAGTYGIDAHKFCAIELDFFSTVKLLHLDEIKYMYINDWNSADKLVSFKTKELI